MTTVSSVAAKEGGLRSLVRRNALLSMYVLMFALAWPGLILEVLYSQGLVSTQAPILLSLLTGWAPGIATVVVSAVLAGRAGVSALLRRFLIWRIGIQWYIVAFLLLAGFILGGIGLQVLLGGPVPAIPAAGAPLLQVFGVFLATVLFGFVINTEEIAWRGFALPRLQAKYNVLTACVLLVIPEVLLHLPYFWNRDIDFYQTVGIFWFTAFSVGLVFIYAFVFNKTGSLLIVTIMHASQNAWANLLSDNTAGPFKFTVVLVWLVALALILVTGGRLGYERPGQQFTGPEEVPAPGRA